ncbi:MAG: DNA repair protein RadC [Candidatus Brocadiales bacterium]|nr:DNA repair protein RadC [Candidatus Brocadiales bacterium]
MKELPSSTNLHGKIYTLIKQNPPSNPPFNKGESSDGVSEPSLQANTFDNDTVALTLFYRLGLIRSKKACKTSTEKVQKTINDIVTFSSDKPEDIKESIGHYSNGICRDVPLCGQCVLTELCRHFKKRPTIKQLPEDERPRERLIKGGEEGLTDAELLGIIIRDGTPEYSAIDLARKLLTKYGDFRNLSTKTIGELRKVHGIGPAKAAQIKAAMAIARRFSTVSLQPGTQFKSSKDIFVHFHEQLRDKKQETFRVVLLDNKNRIIKEIPVSTGSLSQSVVHPREVFNPAIRESAAAVVFVHNHPSGDPLPSSEDIELTQRLKEVSQLVGIKILDHIIIGNGCYTSFKDEGLLF